jgi:hypothetical protein
MYACGYLSLRSSNLSISSKRYHGIFNPSKRRREISENFMLELNKSLVDKRYLIVMDVFGHQTYGPKLSQPYQMLEMVVGC